MPGGENTSGKDAASKKSGKVWSAVLFTFALVVVGVFLYADRHNELSRVLQSLGLAGIVLAVVIKTVISVTPLPNEALLILYMKIYGAWWGSFYAWVGGVLSSFLMYAIARHYGEPILRRLISHERFERINEWVKKRGALGILMVRMLPIPGYITSYAVGTMPSVGLWTYLWTEGASVIPYYIGSALLFMGVMRSHIIWLGLGAAAVVALWVVGYFVRKSFVKESAREER